MHLQGAFVNYFFQPFLKKKEEEEDQGREENNIRITDLIAYITQ